MRAVPPGGHMRRDSCRQIYHDYKSGHFVIGARNKASLHNCWMSLRCRCIHCMASVLDAGQHPRERAR